MYASVLFLLILKCRIADIMELACEDIRGTIYYDYIVTILDEV